MSLGTRFPVLPGIMLLLLGALALAQGKSTNKSSDRIFQRDQLVAWCIVPFDGKKRGPVERAEMLARIGQSLGACHGLDSEGLVWSCHEKALGRADATHAEV